MEKAALKKRNGKALNLIDYVVLLLAVICLVGAVLRIGQTKWLVGNSGLEACEIRFSITDIAYTSAEALVVGDTVTLYEGQTVLGTLKSIDSVVPSTLYVKDADGNILRVNYPEDTRIDVTGTILSHGKTSEKGFLLGGTIHIAPGRSYRVQSEHMDFTLSILDIEVP